MGIPHDAPTPNPEASVKEAVYRELAIMRRELRHELDEHKKRIDRLEKPHEDIILTLNSHDDRLDKHDDRLDKLDEVAVLLSKHFATDEMWQVGISHSVKEMESLLRDLVGRKP